MTNRRRVSPKKGNSKNRDFSEKDFDFSVNPKDKNADDPFLHSLDNMKEKDIGKKGSHSAKKKKKSSPLTVIILIFSIAVFIGCAIYLVNNLYEKKQGSDLYDGLASEYFSNIDFSGNSAEEVIEEKNDGTVTRLPSAKSAQKILCLTERIAKGANVTSGDFDSQLEQVRASISALKEQNADTYGWITVPNTTINYPVMQASDNDWYLNHDYTGRYLVVGTIFADYRINKSIYRNFNTVLYGHNLTTGGMFHDVTKFLDEEFFLNNLIYVYTMDGVYVYQPFAIFEASSDYNYFRTEFASTDEFISFANEMQENSVHSYRTEFISTDRIITLSTCTNGAQTQRWCLQAKLVQVIN